MLRELVEGKSLDELIREDATLETLISALARAADQLTLVHRAGFLHGDVKPANVIVEANGAATFVDLGLAAPWREGGAPAEGLTPRYAAPELFEGRPLTVRAEVYALGVTLAEILEATRAAERAPAVAEELRAVVARATAERQDDRYPSVDEFAQVVRRAAGLAPQPVALPGDVALWPIVGIDQTSSGLLDAVLALPAGGVLRLSGPPSSGRSALLRRLAWSLGAEGAGHGVDQLGGDPQPFAGAPQAAPQHVPGAELPRQFLGRAIAQRERHGCEHGDGPEAPERGDDVFRHAVGKIGDARRPFLDLEGQHGEPRGLSVCACRSGPIVPHEPVPDPRHRHDPVPPIGPRPQRLT
jgi:hypothetical protein